MKRSWNASSLVRRTVLMFEMLSETASSHFRWTIRPDPEIPSVSKMATSGRPERGAQGVVLPVERVQGQLVAQAGLGGDQRLRVEVDVVAVGVGRLERSGDRPTVDLRRLAVAQGAAERGLEVDAAGEEPRGVDVGEVVGGDALALGQPGEAGVQRGGGDLADHGAGRRRVQWDTFDLRGTRKGTRERVRGPPIRGDVVLSVLFPHRHLGPRA